MKKIVKKNITTLFFIISIVTLFACADDEIIGTGIEINGAVQKGPLIVGTPIFVSELDESGNPGQSLSMTEIEDSIGSFSFTSGANKAIQLTATGYYFSEVTGQISSGMLTLKSIFDVSNSDKQLANINILTHLTNDRILTLIGTGKISLGDAIQQGQKELIDALSAVLPVDQLPNFSALSIYDINPDNHIGNAYLLALSASLYNYARIKAEGKDTSVDAQMSLILNLISKDFADDGQIQLEGFIEDLTVALRSLNINKIAENLRNRSNIDYSEPLPVPDISMFLGLCAGTAECMWSSRAPLPYVTVGHAAAAYKNKLYVFGGNSPIDYDSTGTIAKEDAFTHVYEYDIESNQWSTKTPMPIGFADLSAHLVGNEIYVLGSHPGNYFDSLSNSVLKFDPLTNSWEKLAPRPTYRGGFVSGEIGGKIYIFGGRGRVNEEEVGGLVENKKLVEIFDPLDGWSNGTSAPVDLIDAAGCTTKDEIYFFGGGAASSGTYIYNVTDDEWKKRSSSPNPRYLHKCVSVGDKIYVMGGRTLGQENVPIYATDLLEIYSSVLDTWSEESYLPTPRRNFSATGIGSAIYLIGGSDENYMDLDSVEVLDTSLIDLN